MPHTSAFDPLFTLLDQYKQISQLDLETQKNLTALQLWQKQRLQHSHHTLFEKPENKKMATFFLDRLYGNNDTVVILAEQISRVLHYTQKIEKLVPKKTIETAISSIQITLQALMLDVELARYFTEHKITQVTETTIIDAYRAIDQEVTRIELFNGLEQFGEMIDRYAHSFLVLSAFKLAKNSAYKHNLQYLYDFIGEGFAATKPLDSAASFLKQFTTTEKAIVSAVHQGNLHPFGDFNAN